MENSRNDSPLGLDINVNGSQNDVLIPPHMPFNHNVQKGDDKKSQMKLVFMKLNPLIRMILASIDNLIKEYNRISVRDKSGVEKTKFSSMEKLVAVQKVQLEAWQKLRGELEILKEGSYEYIRETVCEMQSFIFLPIILSFQSFQKIMGQEIQRSARLDGINTMKHDFLHRCQEETSICVELVLDILFENKGLVDNDSKHFVPELDPELRVKCISGATNVFSYLTIQLAQMKQSMRDPQDRKSSLTLNSVEECLVRVISCMGALCSRFHNKNYSSGNRNEFLECLEMCQNRKWIIEVSRGLNSIFDSDRESNHENRESLVISPWTFLNEWSVYASTNVKGNVPLKAETLKTLRKMIELELNDKQQDFVQTKSSSKFQVSSWRTCFPTLFRILFREAMIQLRFTSPQSSPVVAREALVTLSCLLKKTLQDSELETKTIRIDPDIMEILKSPSTPTIEREPRILSQDLKFFLEKAQSTIPKSLSMILHLVPTQHSTKVKHAGIVLSRSILFDLQDGLNEKVSSHSENDQPCINDKLHTEALECTIILSRDPDEAVSTTCKEILKQYQTRCVREESTDNFRRRVTSRVGTLLNSIVSLGQSGRDAELETTMKLISGYLEIMMRTKSSKDKKSVYQGFYYQQLTKGHEKTCLKELFKIDSEVKASAKLIQYPDCSEFIIEYKFIRGTMIEVAHGMVHNIAKIIGYKKMILFVDECCVDVYEVFSQRIANGRSLFDLEHARYCSKESGLFTIAIEMLKSFKENEHQRKQKMLLSLASSLIPLLCSDVLWQLPSRSVLSMPKHADSEGNLRLDSSSLSLYSQKQGAEDAPISSQALSTNGSLLVCIMNLISTLANCIGSPFSKFIPILLHPLVQKMSELNSQPVRDAAYSTLVNISRVCNYCSVQEMLLSNYNILVEVLSNELGSVNRTEMELHSQTVCFYSLSNVINILLESQDGQIDPETSSTRILQLCDMQDSLIEWFGQNFTLNTNTLMRHPSIPIGLLSVLGSSIGFINIILTKLVHEYDFEKKEFDDGFQWLDLFIEFELDIDTEQKEEEVKKESQIKNGNLGKSTISAYSLGRLTTNLRKILTTSATLITVPNLILQRKAFDLFRDIFQGLSLVQTLTKNGDDTDPEITKIGNPLFEAIAHVWPSIDLRLQTTTTSFVEFPKNSDVPRRTIIFLLKSIFDMTSELPTLCGDFIANKFETSIWPQMSRLFRCFLVNIEQLARYPLSNVEEELILSMLGCLHQFFASKTCGTRLSTTSIRVVATILFSFLSRSDKIGDVSLDVLKVIHCIDSDCVWRQVLEYGGFGVPFCPLSSLKVMNMTSSGKQTYGDQDPLLAKRCCDLISYASILPEQRL